MQVRDDAESGGIPRVTLRDAVGQPLRAAVWDAGEYERVGLELRADRRGLGLGFGARLPEDSTVAESKAILRCWWVLVVLIKVLLSTWATLGSMTTVPMSRSSFDHRKAHNSPRRAPDVIANHTSAPPSKITEGLFDDPSGPRWRSVGWGLATVRPAAPRS